jgi:serine/threonine protein kinase
VYGPGARIGSDLTVLDHIGGTRKVDIYACRSRGLRKQVACKVLRPEYRIHFKSLDAVRREGEFLARLHHPNVVEGYRYSLQPTPIVVMQLLTGQDLRTAYFTGNYAAFRITHAIEVAKQIATALEYVHGLGILHLDVKPSNVFYSDGHATLIDFSVAREFDPAHLPRDNSGTRDWMAPEQTYRKHVGPYTDVFGLGVVFYQMLSAGRLPFPLIERPADDVTEGTVKVPNYDAEPESPSAINDEVSEELARIALRAISPAISNRFATPAEFLAALEHTAC